MVSVGDEFIDETEGLSDDVVGLAFDRQTHGITDGHAEEGADSFAFHFFAGEWLFHFIFHRVLIFVGRFQWKYCMLSRSFVLRFPAMTRGRSCAYPLLRPLKRL